MAKAKQQKQPRLEGTEDPEIPEIVAAAAPIIATDGEIADLKSKLKTVKERRKTENVTLLAALKKHLPEGQDHYRVGEIEAWIDHGEEEAKAKHISEDSDDE